MHSRMPFPPIALSAPPRWSGYPKRQAQQGFAVVFVLAILSLLLLLMAALMSRTSQLQLRTIGLVHQQQAKAHMIGAQAWAMELLQDDKRRTSIDELDEDWALPVPFIPIDGGGITGQITDLSGRFYINNLRFNGTSDPVWTGLMKHLLQTNDANTQVVEHLIDWLDENVETSTSALEDGWYMNRELPYRSANQPMVHVSELKLVQGFSAELVNSLKSNVFAAKLTDDKRVAININTAPDAILDAIVALLDDANITLDVLLDGRPWQSVDDLPLTPLQGIDEKNSVASLATAVLHKQNLERYLSVKSSVFLLDTQALVGEQTSRLLSTIYRPIDDRPITLIQRQWLPGD
jgi:general secretion pathway protein K